MKDRVKELINQMTLEEKASLCSGKDFWNLKGIERLNIPEIMVTDGPHGLRKQSGAADHLGLNTSVHSTCFPTASASANSWDRKALYEMGQAIGEECVQEEVAVVLGPGVNIKRSPLCGRNFEYFSEDPYLSGECGAAWVQGVQSKGIGTSLKHFAGNNQEKSRLTSNSVIDERALREIYLTSFEKVVKQAKPWTLMCSYNRINGEFGCQNSYTLDECLRKDWGFEGIVMTDWGAMDDRVKSLKAGLELEMPGSAKDNDAEIVKAVEEGTLSEDTLNNRVGKILEMILKSQSFPKGQSYSVDRHHEIARHIAGESTVLLKNDENILPIKKDISYALIGAFAKTPRYQGAGSSKINPHKVDNLLDAFEATGINYNYAAGYSLDKDEVDSQLIEEACACAKERDGVILFAGLPDNYESEGFDRMNMDMPKSHLELIQEVAKVNPNVVVVLMCGSPILMPWKDKVKGILMAYLGGEAVGSACVDVLTGVVNPSGKLAETYPLSLEDTPAYLHFAKDEMDVEYRESIFVGYRYYDWSGKEVLYPFGHGLSYTEFSYDDMKVSWDDTKQMGAASVRVTNTGLVKGKEIVQLYIGKKESHIMVAPKELKGFAKVELSPGQSQIVEIALDNRSFSHFSTANKDWSIEEGIYQIYVAASSRDIRLSKEIYISGETIQESWKYEADKMLNNGILNISRQEFEQVYGGPLPLVPVSDKVNMNTCFGDVLKTEGGKAVFNSLFKQMKEMFSDEDDASRMMLAMLQDIPLRSLGLFTGGRFSKDKINEMIKQINDWEI